MTDYSGGLTLFCEEDHGRTRVEWTDGNRAECPECGREYRVSVTVEAVGDA